MSGPEQPSVIGEEWSDERVKSWLFTTPWDRTISADYQALLKAYQGMRAHDFERFLGFFTEAGRDLNGLNEEGLTILDRVSEHRRSQAYADSLRQHGAKKASGLAE